MSIEAGDGKDRRKKEEEAVVQLRASDQEERFRVSIGCPKRKMGEDRSEVSADFLVGMNLSQVRSKIGKKKRCS